MATAKSGGGQKGLLWTLPEVSSKELGKIGPGFGLGIGCGAGAGIGFFGGKTLLLLPLPRVSLVDSMLIASLRLSYSTRFKILVMTDLGVRQDWV